MDENTCPKCGFDKNDPCCSFVAERDDLKHQIKLEQIMKNTYSNIIKRLEEKIARLEKNNVQEEVNGEISKETPSN